MELQGLIIKASPLFKFFFPNNPLILLKGVSAQETSSARTIFLVWLIKRIKILWLGRLKELFRNRDPAHPDFIQERRFIAGRRKIPLHPALGIHSGLLK